MTCPPLGSGHGAPPGWDGATQVGAEVARQTPLATRKSALSGGDRRPDLAAGGVTLFGQDIAVPVAVMHRDPLVRHRAVDAALEIAVAHVEEMNAPQRAARLHLVT